MVLMQEGNVFVMNSLSSCCIVLYLVSSPQVLDTHHTE